MGTYGERIRAAREAKGWSMNKLANETELHPRTIRRLERELSGPRDSTWQKLTDVLGEL